MKCLVCSSNEMAVSVEDFLYDRHGVAATLVGIRVFRCPACGEEEVEIPRIAELDRVIARHLIEKPGHLASAEIRFLRKFLGLSGRDFAELVGVAPETVSRWENDKQPMEHGHEHALRLLAAIRAPVEDYRLFDALRSIVKPTRIPPVALRLRPDDGKWATAA